MLLAQEELIILFEKILAMVDIGPLLLAFWPVFLCVTIDFQSFRNPIPSRYQIEITTPKAHPSTVLEMVRSFHFPSGIDCFACLRCIVSVNNSRCRKINLAIFDIKVSLDVLGSSLLFFFFEGWKTG